MPTTLKDNSAGARRREEMNDPTRSFQQELRAELKEDFILNFMLSFCKDINYKFKKQQE